MDLRVHVEYEEAINKLQAFMPAVLDWIDAELLESGRRIISRTSKYPPPIPNQKYERTYIYQGTFELRRVGRHQVMVSSNAQQNGRGYSPFVGGGEEGDQQAWMHVGRWPVFRTEADTEMDRFAGRLAEQLNRMAAR